MTDSEIASIADDLEAAAPEAETRAVLQSGDQVVECARLAANRAGLYRIAAVLLRASLAPGQSLSAAAIFCPESEYYLTEVVLDEAPVVVPEVGEGARSKFANMVLASIVFFLIALVLIGAVRVLRWLF